ncbi:MAG: hypothetical protein IKK21_09060 [Clostridia bacterium]|nr:hypothetical protein [Clostridia bacterium]
MAALDHKRLMKMDRLQLMELLESLSRENDALTLRASQLEAANAKMALAAREAEFARDEAQREAAAARQAQIDPAALPTGSFAEAMVQVQEIAARTQTAADEYLAQAKAAAADMERAAAETLENARQESDALLTAAREQADAVTREVEENKARMEGEMKQLSARLHAEMETIAALMHGIAPAEDNQ